MMVVGGLALIVLAGVGVAVYIHKRYVSFFLWRKGVFLEGMGGGGERLLQWIFIMVVFTFNEQNIFLNNF